MSVQGAPADRWALAAVVASHLALSLAFAAATPPWETPDEPWHMGYVLWLRERRALPPPTMAMLETPVRQEASQAPLYYVAAALATAPWSFDSADLRAAFIENPTRFKGVGLAPRQHNYALHGEWDAASRPVVRALRAARGTAALFGALAVVAVWRLMRTVRPGRPWLAVAAAAFAAWTPQFVFLSAAASNDTAVAALATLALTSAVAFPRAPSARAAIRLGAWYGLAALAKSSALALGPLMAVGIVVGAAGGVRWGPAGKAEGTEGADEAQEAQDAGAEGGRSRSNASAEGSVRAALGRVGRWGALALSAAIFAGGWWYARNVLVYHTLFGRALHMAMPWAHRTPHSLARLADDHAFWLLFISYWGVFGWGTVRYPEAVYAIAQWATGAALVGLAWLAAPGVWTAVRSWRGGGEGRRRWRPRGTDIGAAAWGMALCAAWTVLSLVIVVVWMRQVEANWGRLLFPALGAITVLIVSGLDALRPRGAWLAAALAALFVWSATAPVLALRSAYGPPRFLSAADVDALGERVDWRMGDAVTLLSFAPLEPTAPNPGFWPVRLCWKATKRPTFEPSVFVHVVGAADAIVASYDGTPGGGTWPGGAWRPGEAVCERVDVAIGEPDRPVPAPAVYRVAVGMFDRDTRARMATVDRDGRPVVGNFVGQVKVRGAAPDRTAAAPVSVPGAVRFGDGDVDVRLVDREVPAMVCAGGVLTFTLIFDVVAPPREDLQLMVHLRRPGAAAAVAQADGAVHQQGLPYPSSAWARGERLDDARTLDVPADLAPGPYAIAIAFYRLSDLARLNVNVSGTDAPDRAYVLDPPVDVRACR